MSELEFYETCRGYHHGQTDCALLVSKNGQYVGILDFVLYNEECYIENIIVKENQRRKGIATALIKELTKTYEYQALKWSWLTEDEYKFKKAVDKLFQN